MVILKASYIWDEKLNVSLLNMIKIDCDDAYIHPSIHFLPIILGRSTSTRSQLLSPWAFPDWIRVQSLSGRMVPELKPCIEINLTISGSFLSPHTLTQAPSPP